MLGLLWPGTNLANHIIGGEITYRCLSPGFYEVTMKIYRDCQGGGALFDSAPGASAEGTVSVYRGNSQSPFINTIRLDAPTITRVDPDDNPCLIVPPNVCVEEGIYTFNVNLPVSDQSYHIVYQRCCRNVTVNNILTPGDVGATYTVEITPLAQQTCNDSPVFNDFPPIVICNREPLIFDHSATDSDTATQLVYEFCQAFVGGGKRGTAELPGDPTALDGVAPNPDAPPPFIPVNYRVPTYSYNRPLAGNPTIEIDPNTGIISGTPTVTGQFVVTVCVKEFLNGQLLSTVRRDFQFNVASCDRKVFADLEADLVDGNEFEIRSCGSNTVFFDNKSTQAQFIEDYYWEFDIDGNKVTFDSRDVTVTFPGLGQYNGTMIINRDASDERCKDTANISVGIYPDIEANFEFEYDTCKAGPVEFTDLSQTGAPSMKSWHWDYADGDTSNFTNPEHLYQDPGDFPVTLTVTDVNECVEDTTINVNYFPVANLVIVEPSQFVGCSPGKIFFNNLTSPINEDYNIEWRFGDGGTSDEISPTHIYDQVGLFDVAVEITSPIGCFTSARFDNWIEILPGPVADFSFAPEEPTAFNAEISFTDESLFANGYFWDFNGEGNAFTPNPVFTFQDTGKKEIILITIRENGCQDTVVKTIDIKPVSTYHLPNAFTPNGDGVNDEFRGKGIFIGIRSFQMNIWNRWGEKVFETSDPQEGWNGRKMNAGEAAPKGVYVCIVRYVGARGETYEIEELVTLLR